MGDNQMQANHSHSRPSSVSETVSETTSEPYSISSISTFLPPTHHDIDLWNRHISLKEFGEGLQGAAGALFPNETNSRYTKVTALLLSWQDEDPNLPVSIEISRLVDVFSNIYHFDVDEWKIPNQSSHWALNQKIMDFVHPAPNDKEHLKIVYYAGHGRLNKTRLLEWTSWRDKPRSQPPIQPVQWSGIQVLLEQADSDVLILLDCCAGGTANAGGGNGVTELIAACAFNATANGVGQFSFTNALVIELIELSRKPSFSVGALYSNIFIRTQCRLPEHGRERHPAPVHLMLTRQMNFHRSIQISVRLQPQNGKEQLQVPATLLTCGGSSGEVISSDPSGQGRGSNVSCMTGIKTASSLPSDADSTSDCRIISTGDQVPRLLFAIRLKESFQPSELSTDLFCEWLRMIPLVVEEVKVEAGFNSFSSLLIVSLPIALSSYIPKNPAVICLGPITSTNMILQPLNRLFSTQSPSSSSRSPPRPAKTPPSTPPRVGAHIVSRAPTKIAVVEGTSMKTSLGLSPYPRKYPSGGAFSKTDLIPVNNSPITVFYQRDDGTQQSILHNVIRTKSATQNNSDQPELGSEQQSRQSTQNVSDRACELGNVIGRYNQSVGNSGLIELDDLSSNHERLAPPRRRSTWMNRFRASNSHPTADATLSAGDNATVFANTTRTANSHSTLSFASQWSFPRPNVPSGEAAPTISANRSPHYASTCDEAERALPSFSSRTQQATLNSTLSSDSYVPESQESSSFTLPSTSNVSRLSVIEYLLMPFTRISSLYTSWIERQVEEQERLHALYLNFKKDRIEDYPSGWPQLAAFLHSEDNFAIFRRFGVIHCRILVQLQAEIQLLEQKLLDLDRSDSGSSNHWRLLTAEYHDNWDLEQRDLLKQLQEKLLVYDNLLLNEQKLRELGSPSQRDHRSVLHWIVDRKPVGWGQYDWIFHIDDFVSLSKMDHFVSAILSALKRQFHINRSRNPTHNPLLNRFPIARISALAKLLLISLTVGLLIIPIFLLLWIPMNRAWISATIFISILTFSTLMSLFTKTKVKDVLIGTAAYGAVLATFLGNTQGGMYGKGGSA